MNCSARCLQSLLLLGVIGAAATPPACAGLIENGGFETGEFFPWWAPPSVPNQSLFLVGGDGFAHSGTRYAYLSSTSVQYIGQVLPTTAGQDYELSFWVRRGGLAPDQFKVRWEGVLVFNEFMINLDWDVWQHRTVQLHSNITGSFLEFGQDHFPGAFLLDDVSVVQVPGPSSAAVFAVAGVCAVRRRRRTDCPVAAKGQGGLTLRPRLKG